MLNRYPCRLQSLSRVPLGKNVPGTFYCRCESGNKLCIEQCCACTVHHHAYKFAPACTCAEKGITYPFQSRNRRSQQDSGECSASKGWTRVRLVYQATNIHAVPHAHPTILTLLARQTMWRYKRHMRKVAESVPLP